MQDLFVGNISYDATEDDVKELFKDFGNVARVKFINDKTSGQFRGFGFVSMGTKEEAEAAVKALHGRSFLSRDLTVRIAEDRQPANQGRPEREFQHSRRGGSGYRDNGRDSGPRRQRGFTAIEALILLVLVGGFICALFVFPVIRCKSKAGEMGFPSSYSVWNGCMIEVGKGKRVPIEQYRYVPE